ncbi:hypothetical protein G6F55_007238 [Rhizopus delemar]|nr:hypothetical protein G6F55_007238 [Rhizopus delemar]KAG1521479.1 hypothetical protein G6F52_006712 [Rhizopus delemar]KAG1538363.1 hypothetical protein G6F51_009814 [Rhizopus arrhizus]KAG1565921.1 hypothetical protein G6F50_009619 [Rhizopus delemar]
MTITSPLEFQAPMPFAAPMSAFSATPQTSLIHSRLSHYINSICDELDTFEKSKIQTTNFLLKFHDDTPMLDMQVARQFASFTFMMIKQFKSLDSLDASKLGKVIKLLENTVVLSAEIDIVELYVQKNKDKTAIFSMLYLISDAIEVCGILFEILSTCKFDKQHISRTLISNCLQFIKNQLDFIVYPFIDLTEDEASLSNSNAQEVYKLIEEAPKLKALVSTFIPNITRFLRRTFHLLEHEELEDDVLVTVAYISMTPFFHDYSEQNTCILLDTDENDTSTFSPYEQLKISALQVLKHVFSAYPRHRRWIFEEILTSLGSLTVMSDKKNYRLHDNQSIHVVSALFMELVQACSALNNSLAYKNWFRKWNIKYQKAQKNNESQKMKLLNDQLLTKAAKAWRMSAETAANSASYFLEFLMSKCKTKRADVCSLEEYRQLLSNTLEDVMTVFNDPAWPIAELIMKVFSRILISLLEGNHSDQYLKSLAVDWLGMIACKIKSSQNALAGEGNTYTPEWVYDLNDKLPAHIDKDTSIESVELLNQCRKKLLDSVAKESVSASVIQFYLCNWGFMESVVWTKANKGWRIDKKSKTSKNNSAIAAEENSVKEIKGSVEQEDVNMETEDSTLLVPNKEEEEEEEEKWPIEVVELLQNACKYYWLSCLGFEYSFPKPNKPYMFPEMSRNDLTSLVELLASRQSLYTSYDFILSEILLCLDKDAVFLRVRSLKAIGKISSQVPEILEEGRVRVSVIQRVHDPSPSVRDAAVETIAKYLSKQLDISPELYELVGGRIMDTSVAVRKRLVRLLRELYFKFTDIEVKKDIASKLIMRIGDNEETISQQSLKATQEILFLPFKEIEKDGNDYFGYTYANAPKDRKRRINNLTSIIVGAVAKLDSSLSTQNIALSQIVQKTVDGLDEKSRGWYERIFQWIIDSLFDRMILLDEEDNTAEFINCLATVYAFAKSCPNLLRELQISMLQPYLTISEQDDWTKASYVLMIYRDVLPQMKYHDRDTIDLLERILMQLLTKCPLDMTSIGASCLCAIVSQISHRYNILIKILGSCVTKLRQVREAIRQGTVSKSIFSGVLKMILLCGLLCQHFEFDKRREEKPAAMSALDLVYKGEIGTLIFDLLHFFTEDVINELGEQGMVLRMTALQGLGYFYSSNPIFMVSESSTTLMDRIFQEGSASLKTQLMRVFQEFMGAEEKRINKRQEDDKKEEEEEKKTDNNKILANTEEYAELGVSGSLMQRYLPKILECALCEFADLRYAAFEVVSSVIHRALAHPVLCMPAVIAAETSPDVILRTKAYYMHKYAHDKYGLMLYGQMNECISTSFQYQKVLFGNKIQGYGKRGGDSKVESVLSLTYSFLKGHKKIKFDFFQALVRPFTFELKLTSPEDVDIAYLKYLAENIMMMDYSTTSEVLFVVFHIDKLLTSLGADLLSFVQSLKKQGRIVESDECMIDDEDSHENGLEEEITVASKLSIALCMMMLLKKLLIELYDIPDEEVREYSLTQKHRSRDVVKDIEVNQFIDWEEELQYFRYNRLNKQTAVDACTKFEYLIITDATVVITTDTI